MIYKFKHNDCDYQIEALGDIAYVTIDNYGSHFHLAEIWNPFSENPSLTVKQPLGFDIVKMIMDKWLEFYGNLALPGEK